MSTSEDTPENPSRIQELAQSLDCFTEEDLCILCKITPPTAEAWRKRHRGPAFSRVGNRVLYPRRAVAEFLEKQLRQRNEAPARGQL